MGFFDRGKAPASMPGNEGKGNARDGYPRGSTTPGYIDYRNPADNGDFYEGTKRQQYRDDPNARLLHSPGSSRAEQSGWWETSGKNLSDMHEPFSWTAADEARDQAEQAQRRAADDAGWRARGFSGSDWWQSDPEYQQFLASGNKRGASRRKNDLLTEAKRKIQRDSFIAQGGRGETWDHRFDENNHWPVPKSPLGVSSHGPGRPDAPGGRGGVAGTASTKSADGGSKGKSTPSTMPAFIRSLWGARDWRTGEAPQGGVGMIEGYIPDAASTGAGEASPRGNQGFFGSLDRMARSLDGLRAEDMIPGMELPVDQSLGGFAQALKSASAGRKPAAPASRGVRRGGGRVD